MTRRYSPGNILTLLLRKNNSFRVWNAIVRHVNNDVISKNSAGTQKSLNRTYTKFAMEVGWNVYCILLYPRTVSSESDTTQKNEVLH